MFVNMNFESLLEIPGAIAWTALRAG